MKSFNNISRIVVIYALLMTVLSACGSPPTDSTEPPPIQDIELSPADFDGTIIEGNIGDVPIFVGVGSLQNDSGQVLSITVTSPTSASVEDYFDLARFYFEITEPVVFPNTDEPAEREPDLSMEQLMKGEDVEQAGNLSITFKLSPETAQKYPTGAVLVIIDPTVAQNRYNHYAAVDPASNAASVTITVSAGQVRGRLYRACVLRTSGNASPGSPRTLSNTGAGSFDLTVMGWGAGNSTYRVTGRWNFDYNQDLPDLPGGAVC